MARTIVCWATISVMLFLSTGVVSADGKRFVDNGDGTVSDPEHGLMWAKADCNGDINFQNAKRYCENIILSKYSDWRMPAVDELKTLYDNESERYETVCGLDVRVDPAIRLSCGWVWASETKSIAAYVFNFSRGYRYLARKAEKRNYRALPVRTIRPGE